MKFRAACIIIFMLVTYTLPAQQTDKLFLEKIHEPNEKAFTILKPKGWLTEGGIVRWDPNTMGGAANAIEAKIDFALKMNEAGTIKIHWLPDIYFADLTGQAVAGMFPEGSFYNGMPVLHKMSAPEFLKQHVISHVHKDIDKLSILNSKELPEVERLCYDMDMMKQMGCKYSSALLDYAYTENGVRFKERAFCILQDMGPYTAGMWKNRSTIVIRTPDGSFNKWEPVFQEIGASVVLNPVWIQGELQGQQQRGNTMIKTMQDVARIGEEIQKGHAETNAKIHHQVYLTLTEQENYINPYTNEVEMGTNQWDYRWVDDLGNVLYTDNEDYNPNIDIELQMDGFKRSSVKR